MNSFWKIVNDVIDRADLLLLVLDARMPEYTRNMEIESKIKKNHKKMLYVINKCDLIGQERSEKLKGKYKPSVFVSGTKHHGTNLLREKIMAIAHGEEVMVGVLGYPNVGKSSVINMLRGRGSAGVSSISGYTTAMLEVKISGKLRMLDTPGVIPFSEDDEMKQILNGTINFDKVKDPEFAAMDMIEKFDGAIEDFYGLTQDERSEDSEEVLENLALKRNKLKKGGVPDTLTVARNILKDWQHGKILL